MASLYTVANLLHSALVVLFVVVTGLLMVVSIVRRARLRKIRLSWGNGRLFGLPLVPTVFLAIVVALLGLELRIPDSDFSLGWMALLGYLTGGIFWYTSAVLSTSVLVTDWGLSRQRRGKTETLPWHEVTDYVTNESGRNTIYVFFRVDERRRKQRVEVEVPPARRMQFQETVESKLDARFNYYVRRPLGQRALKQ